MWTQFWTQNIHYVIEVFFAFLMVTGAWIYFDGYLVDKRMKTLLRSLGFFTLVAWSLLNAAPINTFGRSINPETLVDLVGLFGFGLIFTSLIIDPVPPKPGQKLPWPFSKLWGDTSSALPITHLAVFGVLGSVFGEPKIWMTIFVVTTTYLLWLHYSKGIQSEWKYFYVGFIFLSVSVFMSIASIGRGSSNVLVAQLSAPFYIVWILENIIKLIGGIFLGIWAWGFIRFRIFPQIFSSFVALSFIIFMTTSILYTGFLLNKTQDKAIDDLKTNIKTLEFALGKIKESSILAARITATNPNVREAMRRGDKEALFNNLNALMFENETDFMLATNIGGEVLMRAEDKERFGDSLAEDPVVWRALDGKAVVTVASETGITIPTVSIRAASPIVDTSDSGDPEIIGTIVTGYRLDTAFVDGIKNITNLDVTIFAEDAISATTFMVPEGNLRLLGVREQNQEVLETVLKKGKIFTGISNVLNQPYLSAYVPVRDIEEVNAGMLFTGRSQALVLAIAENTMRLTFSISVILMIVSILPLWWLARFITYHQKI